MKAIEDAVRDNNGEWPGDHPLSEVLVWAGSSWNAWPKEWAGKEVYDWYEVCTRTEFDQCTDRLRNEPDWKDAPVWAKAKAQDRDGEWYWYGVRPEREEWVFATMGTTLLASKGEVIGDWRDTLRLRPAENKMEEQAGQTTVDENLYKDALRYRYLRDEDNWGQDDDAWAQLGESHAGEFDDFVDARMMAIEAEFIKRVNELQSAPTEDWHERGEFPPVGTVCEYKLSDCYWYAVEITAVTKHGLCFVRLGTSDENYVPSSSKFRPIQTEREQWIERTQLAVDIPLGHAMLGKISDSWPDNLVHPKSKEVEEADWQHRGEFPDIERDDVIHRINELQGALDDVWYKLGEYPPAGTVCEVLYVSTWRRTKIIGWNNDNIVITTEWDDTYSYDGLLAQPWMFRPIKTEREQWIEKACKVAVDSYCIEDTVKSLADAGMLKMPEEK